MQAFGGKLGLLQMLDGTNALSHDLADSGPFYSLQRMFSFGPTHGSAEPVVKEEKGLAKAGLAACTASGFPNLSSLFILQ